MRYFCLGAGFGPFFLSCLGFITFLSFFVALFPFPMIFSIDIEGRFEPTVTDTFSNYSRFPRRKEISYFDPFRRTAPSHLLLAEISRTFLCVYDDGTTIERQLVVSISKDPCCRGGRTLDVLRQRLETPSILR